MRTRKYDKAVRCVPGNWGDEGDISNITYNKKNVLTKYIINFV